MRPWHVGTLTHCITALAQIPISDKLCATTCRKTFQTLRFSDIPSGQAFPLNECTSRLHHQALYLCWRVHCAAQVRLAESISLNETCQDLVGSRLPPYSIVYEFTEQDVARLTRFNATFPTREQPVSSPMLPSSEFYHSWARTLDALDYVHYYHYCYGWAMGIFWALVVAVGISNRALEQLETRSPEPLSAEKRIWTWLKRKILRPATFGRRCVQDVGGWGTVPPRVQTLTLSLFVLINVVCSLHGYRIFEGNIYYPSTTMQILRHVSDRTGIISFANFPMIWLFGMRNNLMIWLTGWNPGTYNNFHRWVARIATVQAVIHSIGYTVLILRKGGWEYFWRLWTLTFWWTGELATVFMSLLVLLSAFWIRRRQYEAFLIIHIALSVLILVTMLGHVHIFKGRYNALVWVPSLIWLLDRILRAVRILYFNPVFWDTTAIVSYNKRAHMIRVVVPVSWRFYCIQPGTFYYIMVLNKWNFWESHPFTVASASVGGQFNAEPQETSLLLERSPSPLTELGGGPKRSAGRMTFLIRPYDGFTSRLQEYAESSWPKPATVRVAIDGPYGETLPLERFDRVLFVVGGSGIAVPLSYLRKLTFMDRPGMIDIHWAVQQAALAVDILGCELCCILDSHRVQVNVYVTRPGNGAVSDEVNHRNVKCKAGRMDVEEVVEAALYAGERTSLAVVACGPATMADECRRVVVSRMLSSLPRIEYFEETFQ